MDKSTPPAQPVRSVAIHSFIVHVWREKARARRFVWRGSLTDVKSGSVKYFQSLSTLAKLMAEILRARSEEKGVASKK